MAFSVEQALRIATANLASRAKSKSTAYTLYFSNDGHRYEGKLHGVSMRELKGEFTALGTAYRYAFITKNGSDEVIQFFNRSECRKDKNGIYKFFSMTRKSKQ